MADSTRHHTRASAYAKTWGSAGRCRGVGSPRHGRELLRCHTVRGRRQLFTTATLTSGQGVASLPHHRGTQPARFWPLPRAKSKVLQRLTAAPRMACCAQVLHLRSPAWEGERSSNSRLSQLPWVLASPWAAQRRLERTLGPAQRLCVQWRAIALLQAPQMAGVPDFPGQLPPRGPRSSSPTRVKSSRRRKVCGRVGLELAAALPHPSTSA